MKGMEIEKGMTFVIILGGIVFMIVCLIKSLCKGVTGLDLFLIFLVIPLLTAIFAGLGGGRGLRWDE